MLNNLGLNNRVSNNFMKVKYGLLIPPFLLLTLCALYFLLFSENGNFIEWICNRKLNG